MSGGGVEVGGEVAGRLELDRLAGLGVGKAGSTLAPAMIWSD
ncbi:MAG: hypothetical protein R3F11_24730 [Verrucomicrobiales bacterium]